MKYDGWLRKCYKADVSMAAFIMYLVIVTVIQNT